LVPEAAKISRRLAAILAADIAEYARLMGEDEPATVQALKDHQAVVLPLVAEYRGRVIDTAGDGMLAEFPSVIDAVECAVEIQIVMLRRNDNVPHGRRMQFRIGINLGDVIHDDVRIYGDGINIAARLEAMSQPGAICVSSKVRDEVIDKLPLQFVDLGEHTLKNIARAVRVYALQFPASGAPAPAISPARSPEVFSGTGFGDRPIRTPKQLASPSTTATLTNARPVEFSDSDSLGALFASQLWGRDSDLRSLVEQVVSVPLISIVVRHH
jgi:class 3 adenylate cyclase